MDRTRHALDSLWDENTGQYCSRSFVSHKLIQISTIAALLPLYSAAISPERAKKLERLLESPQLYGPIWPVPSVAISSPDFDGFKYWQGPSWVNTNWLIIEGLKDSGFDNKAKALTDKTLELVQNSGMNEYFNPLSGEPAGAKNFSWTAALTIDLLNN
jgi:glycogen debranching enzyme